MTYYKLYGLISLNFFRNSEKCGVGHNTVLETLKLLEKTNIIERRTGAIMVSPKLMNNWKGGKEATMMIKYKEFSGNDEE